MLATGTFDVKRLPHPPYERAEGATLSRVTITKRFKGDLEGDSVFQMLCAVTEVDGSAGYAGIERVTGTLRGHSGTFILQHAGTITRGVPAWTISVVPDSGSGTLRGIAGTMTVNVVDGQHSYAFDYTLGQGA